MDVSFSLNYKVVSYKGVVRIFISIEVRSGVGLHYAEDYRVSFIVYDRPFSPAPVFLVNVAVMFNWTKIKSIFTNTPTYFFRRCETLSLG